MEDTELQELIEPCEFEYSGFFDATKLVVRPEVRNMCSCDLCNAYGHSWMCPPGIGTVEECAQLLSNYSKGILFQTVGKMEDSFDWETIERTKELHKDRMIRLLDAVYDRFGSADGEVKVLNAGTCTYCKKCTYPDHPCAHPKKAAPSMEAVGLMVNEVCTMAGVDYNHGPATMAFSSCILYN